MHIGAHPRFIDVGRGARDLLGHHGGEGDPDGAVPIALPDNLRDHFGHRFRRCRLRRSNLHAFAHEIAGAQIHYGPLHAGAAHINAET